MNSKTEKIVVELYASTYDLNGRKAITSSERDCLFNVFCEIIRKDFIIINFEDEKN